MAFDWHTGVSCFPAQHSFQLTVVQLSLTLILSAYSTESVMHLWWILKSNFFYKFETILASAVFFLHQFCCRWLGWLPAWSGCLSMFHGLAGGFWPGSSLLHLSSAFRGPGGICTRLDLSPRGATKSSPQTFCSFLSNNLEFQSKIFPAYLVILHAHNSIIVIQLAYSILESSAVLSCSVPSLETPTRWNLKLPGLKFPWKNDLNLGKIRTSIHSIPGVLTSKSVQMDVFA